MANPHRATVTVDLGDPPVAHDLCLTNSALVEVEAELKCDSPELLAGVGVAKATVIIHAALKGAGKNVDRPAVVKLLHPMNAKNIIMAASKALRAAFTDPDPNPPQEGASPSA